MNPETVMVRFCGEEFTLPISLYDTLRDLVTSRAFLDVTTESPNRLAFFRVNGQPVYDDCLLVPGDVIELDTTCEKAVITPKDVIKKLRHMVETWSAIQAALVNGRRGLRGGSSLAQLLERKRGVRSKSNLPCLSREGIVGWIREHYRRYERLPTANAGPILGTGETWKGVEMALFFGLRGLKKGKSLAQMVRELSHRGCVPIK